jgi:hypothetical protein
MHPYRMAVLSAWFIVLLISPLSLQAEMRYDDLIGIAAHRYEVEPALVKAVIRCESNFDASAISSKGAQGLMQLMPATQATLGITDAFDPLQNIDAGVRYLATLRQSFGTDRSLLLAAYNAGPQAVIHAGYSVPNYGETQRYIACVEQARRHYRDLRFNAAFAKLPPDTPAPDRLAVALPRLPASIYQVGRRLQFQFDTWNTGPASTYGVVSVTYPPALLSMIIMRTSPERTTVALPPPADTEEQAAQAYTFLQDEWPQWSSGQRHTVTLAVVPRLAQDVMLHLSVILYDQERKTMQQRWSRMVQIPVQALEEDGRR